MSLHFLPLFPLAPLCPLALLVFALSLATRVSPALHASQCKREECKVPEKPEVQGHNWAQEGARKCCRNARFWDKYKKGTGEAWVQAQDAQKAQNQEKEAENANTAVSHLIKLSRPDIFNELVLRAETLGQFIRVIWFSLYLLLCTHNEYIMDMEQR